MYCKVKITTRGPLHTVPIDINREHPLADSEQSVVRLQKSSCATDLSSNQTEVEGALHSFHLPVMMSVNTSEIQSFISQLVIMEESNIMTVLSDLHLQQLRCLLNSAWK